MRKRPFPSPESESLDEPLINLTPLIDVVFVVLITFMLIAPILDVDLVELASGGNSSKKEFSHSSLIISIRADNSLWFRGKQMTLPDLEKALLMEKMGHPHSIPQVMPDKRSHFETYQAVKNTLEACGFEQMDVLLQSR